MIGPLIVLAWGAVFLASILAPIVHAVRHGRRRVGTSFFAPLGAILSTAAIIAAIGTLEPGALSPAMATILALVGFVGLVFIWLGWRAVLRPIPGPTDCPACGYAMANLPRCPECGHTPTPAPLTDSP